MYDLAICAVLKNEGRYLREWLAFHIEVGVEHFYLYDNDSTDDTWGLINCHPAITAIQMSGAPIQLAAYAHCLQHAQTKWLGFIDADEFLFNPDGRDLRDVLNDFSQHPAIVVHWILFGSNGHWSYRPQPVIQRFQTRANVVNDHVKSIVQPRRTLSIGRDPHRFICDAVAVDEHGNVVDGAPLQPNGTADRLRINHYVLKSREEYQARCRLSRADNNQLRDWRRNFDHHDRNEIIDSTAASLYLKPVLDAELIARQWNI